jgi:hypothetical protein
MGILLVGLTAIATAAGCSQGGVKEQEIQVSEANDPLHEPRSILKRYAEGQPLGSEVNSFPALVDNVRKTDPGRADVLDKGLKDIQHAAPGERAAKAKDLLQKLQPSMK